MMFLSHRLLGKILVLVFMFAPLANTISTNEVSFTTPVPMTKTVPAYTTAMRGQQTTSRKYPIRLKWLTTIDLLANSTHAGGAYPARDVLVELVNKNASLLEAYDISIDAFPTNVRKIYRFFY